jgi:hypothetical protein
VVQLPGFSPILSINLNDREFFAGTDFAAVFQEEHAFNEVGNDTTGN